MRRFHVLVFEDPDSEKEKPLRWRMILIFGLLGAGLVTVMGLLPKGFGIVQPTVALVILGYIVATFVNYRRFAHAEISGAVAYLVVLLMRAGEWVELTNELEGQVITPELIIPFVIVIALGGILIGLVIVSIITGIGAWIYKKKEILVSKMRSAEDEIANGRDRHNGKR